MIDSINSIIIEGLAFSLPMFIMAIGGIFSEKSGVTNLALEGFQGFGAFTGSRVAIVLMHTLGADSSIPFWVSLIFAVLGGMLYSLLHAVLCIRFKANQVISGVVVNILAMALTEFLTKRLNTALWNETSNKFVLSVSSRITIPGISNIPIIGAVFSKVYPFEFVIIIIAVIMYFVMYGTRFGLHLRACGDNPHAVDAAGISVAKVRYAAVMVSGALSGLAGICFAYSISGNFSPAIYMGYGYLSIAAYIFGNWSIMPTFFACLLFGLSRSAGYQIIRVLGMPSSYSDLVMILPYVLTLFLLVFFSKHTGAPRALGVVYDKGGR